MMSSEAHGPSKRKKLSEEERLRRCRERNRVHARNTRERKKMQLDTLQIRIQDLMEEKKRLKTVIVETSVASILMALAGCPTAPSVEESNQAVDENEAALDEIARNYATMTIENLRSQVSSEISDDEELELDQALLKKDRASCTSKELELIRKERNRLHAKKTRLRKKKMLFEMESIVCRLEGEVRSLKESRGIPCDDMKLTSDCVVDDDDDDDDEEENMDDMNRSKDGSRADNIENNYIGEKDESLSQSCNKQLHPSFPLHDQRDFYNFGNSLAEYMRSLGHLDRTHQSVTTCKNTSYSTNDESSSNEALNEIMKTQKTGVSTSGAVVDELVSNQVSGIETNQKPIPEFSRSSVPSSSSNNLGSARSRMKSEARSGIKSECSASTDNDSEDMEDEYVDNDNNDQRYADNDHNDQRYCSSLGSTVSSASSSSSVWSSIAAGRNYDNLERESTGKNHHGLPRPRSQKRKFEHACGADVGKEKHPRSATINGTPVDGTDVNVQFDVSKARQMSFASEKGKYASDKLKHTNEKVKSSLTREDLNMHATEMMKNKVMSSHHNTSSNRSDDLFSSCSSLSDNDFGPHTDNVYDDFYSFKTIETARRKMQAKAFAPSSRASFKLLSHNPMLEQGQESTGHTRNCNTDDDSTDDSTNTNDDINDDTCRYPTASLAN